MTVDTAAGGLRYMLGEVRVELHMQDGTRSALAARSMGSLNGPRLVRDGEELVPSGEWGRNPRRGSLQVEMTREQAAAVDRGEAWLDIQARVEVQELRVLGVVPLASGTALAAGGLRLEILDVDRVERQLSMRTSSVRPRDIARESGSMVGSHTFALVNLTRAPAEEITLYGRDGGGSSLGAVIPGAPLHRWIGVYGPPRRFGAATTADPDWMRGASLLIGEWVPLGSYPFAVTVRPGTQL